MTDEKGRPDDSQGSDNTDPAGSNAGQSNNNNAQAPSDTLPSSLQGKSAQEIANMYVNLEKKLGEQSGEVESARKLKDDMEIMLRAVWSDPDLYRQVESKIRALTGGEELTPSQPPEKKEGDGEDKGLKEVDPITSDLRKAEENRVLNEFFTKFGYNHLDEKDRKDKYAQLSVSLGELVDPQGNRPLREILASIPLSKLPKYLENAHFIANKDQIISQGKQSALLSQQENEAASIGSFAASSGKKDQGVILSARERETAQKMGISEEKYAQRKAEIMQDADKFE